MNKKLLLKYILMYIPFIVGTVLFSVGTINLFSSLLLFVGGYVAIKNTFDYRKLKKNINGVKINPEEESRTFETESSEKAKTVNVHKDNMSEKVYIKPMNPEDVIGFKRTRRYSRVRRKY